MKRISLVLVFIAVTAIAYLYWQKPREVAAGKSTPNLKPTASNALVRIGSSLDTGDSRSAAAKIAAISPHEFKEFQDFRSAVGVVDSRMAATIGLSDDQQMSIRFIVWTARKELDRLCAATAVVSHPTQDQTVVSFHLDGKTSADIQTRTLASLRDVVTDAQWSQLQQSPVMQLIDRTLDGFGRPATAYSIKTHAVSGTLYVSMDVLRDDRPNTVITYNYSAPTFKSIFGELASKAGL